MSLILGIDPGSHNTGYGLVTCAGAQISVVDFGTISAKSSLSFEERILQIGLELERLFKEFKPSHVVIEEIFTAKNVKSSLQLAHVRGVGVFLAKKNGATVHSYSTKIVKKGVTANGSASKEQVALSLKGLLGVDIGINKLDATDALALAFFHATRLEILEKFGAYQSLS